MNCGKTAMSCIFCLFIWICVRRYCLISQSKLLLISTPAFFTSFIYKVQASIVRVEVFLMVY